MDWIDRLPKYIERLVRENHESLAALGRAIGKSRQTVSAWKRGDTDPPLRDLAKILDRYGISLHELADSIGGKPVDFASAALLTKLEPTFDKPLDGLAERRQLTDVLVSLRAEQDQRIKELEEGIAALEPESDEQTDKQSE